MAHQESKTLLLRGKTKEALDVLEPAVKQTELYDEWAMLRARYSRMREQEMKGTASAEERQLEHNRINDALLRLIAQAESGAVPDAAPSTSGGAPRQKANWRVWAIAAVAAVVLIGILTRRQNAELDETAAGLPVQTEQQSVPAGAEEPAQAGAVAPPKRQSAKPERQEEKTSADSRPASPAAEDAPPPQKAAAEKPQEAAVEDFSDEVYDRYYIGKLGSQDDFVYDINELGKGSRSVYLDMRIKNDFSGPMKLGSIKLLHTDGKQEAVSNLVKGKVLQPNERDTINPLFKMAIPGEPRAFRIELTYHKEGAIGARRMKTVFGIYRKIGE